MPLILTREALEEELRFAESQASTADDDEWGTTSLLWESRVADLRQQMEQLTTTTSAEASVALIFQGRPVVGQREIKLDFATSALENYQKIISLAVAAQTDDSIGGKGPVRNADGSKLYIRDLIRGSFGFLLEEQFESQAPLFPTPLKLAIAEVSRLFGDLSSSDPQIFEQAVEKSQGRLLAAVQKFSKILAGGGATLSIVDDNSRTSLDEPAISLIVGRLDDISVQEVRSTVTGLLLGILPESHQFEIKFPPDGGVMKGSITDDLALRYQATTDIKNMTLRMVRAEIVTVQTFRRSVLAKEQIFLEEVSLAREIDEPSHLVAGRQ